MLQPGTMKRVVLYSMIAHAGLLLAGAFIKPVPWERGPETRGVEMEFTLAPDPAPITPPRREERTAQTPSIASIATPPAPARVEPVRVAPRAPRLARLAVPAPQAPTVAPTPETAAPAPTASAPATTAPPISAGHLLTSAASDVAAIGDNGGNVLGTGTTPRDRNEQVRAAAQGYVAEVIADANPIEPSRVHAYYGSLARRMRETWRPGFYRTPSMVEALIALPRAMVHYREMYRRRAARFANTGRPDDPTQMDAMPSFEDRQSFAASLTSTIIEVEQDETGRVLSMRVIRPARVHDFDEAALAAVRAAIPDTAAVPMPGGRRSRWAFDVVASRDPILPIAGLSFNESNGFFEMNYPGALHVRTRIRTIGSRPLNVPWSAPHPATN